MMLHLLLNEAFKVILYIFKHDVLCDLALTILRIKAILSKLRVPSFERHEVAQQSLASKQIL